MGPGRHPSGRTTHQTIPMTRQEFLATLRYLGFPVKRFCELTGVSSVTVYQWDKPTNAKVPKWAVLLVALIEENRKLNERLESAPHLDQAERKTQPACPDSPANTQTPP